MFQNLIGYFNKLKTFDILDCSFFWTNLTLFVKLYKLSLGNFNCTKFAY